MAESAASSENPVSHRPRDLAVPLPGVFLGEVLTDARTWTGTRAHMEVARTSAEPEASHRSIDGRARVGIGVWPLGYVSFSS